MEVVKAFNAELQSLYDTKPPISKAKMTLITRSAMKAIKFYKHVVQSVEKFIQKCKPEYKVPGLYVIDSIVRQSRHQYSPDKDVFAPRFSRNIKTTFLHLFNCSQEDKSKIVRVLNLWQKNNVFTADVIQPLLDLAASVANKDTVSTNGVQAKTPPHSGNQPRTPNSKSSPTKDPAWLTGGRNQATENNNENKSAPAAAPKVKMDKKLFDYDYGEDDDDDRVASASPIRNQAQSTPAQQTPLPNLESLSSILSNPEVLRQLHTLQQQMAARQQQQEMEDKMRRLQEMKHQEEEFDRHLAQTVPKLPFAAECELQPNLTVGGVNSTPSGVAPPHGGVPLPGGVAPLSGMPPTSVPPPSVPPPTGVMAPSGVPLPGSEGASINLGTAMPSAFLSQIDLPPLMVQPPPVPPPSFTSQSSSFPSLDIAVDRAATDYDERTRQMDIGRSLKEDSSIEEGEMNDDSIEVIDLVRSPSTRDSDHRRYRNRSRSKDRYRRSRSRSRSRRRRSRSSDRDDRDDREYDRKQRDLDREKERERKKKGLPIPRRNHLTVCSTTLWIGHLSKLIHEDQLSNIFGEYGDIVSINLIPPRGCAFVCMNRRQDAMKALHELKHYKIQSKSITVAWAPGKGMKDKEWKDYWEVEHGASFIPWNKLSSKTNFELLEEGGMLDQDTFPEWLKDTYNTLKKQMEDKRAKEEENTKTKVEELPPLPSGPQPPPSVPTSTPPDLRGPPPPQPPPPTPLPPPPMGMLPPPPFPLQPPGLLGAMSMSMPPGLVGPLGVPPPIMVPQQMIPRMPPPFNAPPQSFGIMDGMPPPPLPNAGNPFGAPPMIPTVNNSISNSTSNKDPTEMDVVDESEEELPKKDEISMPIQSLPLPPSPFPGMPPLPNIGSNGRDLSDAVKLSEDTDMRMIEAEQSRKRKWGSEDDAFRHRHNNRWPERDRDRGGAGSPLERRNEERPPLIPNTPVMPPDFPPFPNNRHVITGGRGPDEEDVYPAAMIDFPPRDFQSRDFLPRDFPPRGGANHFFNPRGPMFGPRGPPPGHSPMNLRPPRHPIHPGIRGGADGRGGWGPPPPQQGLARGGRFTLLHPPPPLVPNRRPPGERKSRWGEPVEQSSEDMFASQPEDIFPMQCEDMFSGPLKTVASEDRLSGQLNESTNEPSRNTSCSPNQQCDLPKDLNLEEFKCSETPGDISSESPFDSSICPPGDSAFESTQDILCNQICANSPDKISPEPSENLLPNPPESIISLNSTLSADDSLNHNKDYSLLPDNISASPKNVPSEILANVFSNNPGESATDSTMEKMLVSPEDKCLIPIEDKLPIPNEDKLPIHPEDKFPTLIEDKLLVSSVDKLSLPSEDNLPVPEDKFPVSHEPNFPVPSEDNYSNPIEDLKSNTQENIFSNEKVGIPQLICENVSGPLKDVLPNPSDIFSDIPDDAPKSCRSNELTDPVPSDVAPEVPLDNSTSRISLYSPDIGMENELASDSVSDMPSSDPLNVPSLMPVSGVDTSFEKPDFTEQPAQDSDTSVQHEVSTTEHSNTQISEEST